MKQHEAVIEALRLNGGYATLGQLYQAVLQIPDCKWGTKTPLATIRRIVQTRPSLFFRIRPGLWGLTEQRETILRTLNIATGTTPKQVAEFGHSYYQGLVVQIGNLSGYQTHVPNQDRNKRFLAGTIADVATLPQLPDFTYAHLVRRARTIDVVWLNDRRLPHAFFEIEHSTDIYNSLLKFTEFQDFRIGFYVVADAVRKAEFESKITYSAFSPIRSSVKFMDYESLSEYHTKVAAIALLKQRLSL